ncbi:MAG: hypothetical protein COT17_04025 [Elusimicrobia bacterium CG08_land_8_20_14_0_20_51_18]|nr:MAG: hypothetical protein COT17_04025 [Elusimicrobia bacterium CG08_land_8_20_14_0_20_51_18]
MEAICKLKYQRYARTKISRLVDQVRGKNLFEAEHMLNALNSSSKTVVKKAIKSAGANLSIKLGRKIDLKNVWIKQVYADQGPMKSLRRFNAGPQGRAMPFTRAMCHLTVVVSDSRPACRSLGAGRE